MNQLKLVRVTIAIQNQASKITDLTCSRPDLHNGLLLCVTIGTCARVIPTPSGR